MGILRHRPEADPDELSKRVTSPGESIAEFRRRVETEAHVQDASNPA